MKRLLFLVPFLFFGCSTVSSDLSKNEQDREELARRAALAEQPVIADLPTSRDKTALGELNSQVTLNLGLPKDPNEAINFGRALASGDAQAQAEYQAMVGDTSKLARENEILKAQLIELGRQKEAENNRSWISRIWTIVIGTFGLGGTIALCVLFPPLLPILGTAATWFFNFVIHLFTSFEQFISNEISQMAHKKFATTPTTTK
jgi:hypothetical protein